jgi:para-nitrobenzyl esterase
VPVIEGTNHDEGRLFVALAFDLNPGVGPLTAAEYPAVIQAIAQTAVSEGASVLGSTSSSSSTQEVQQITQEILNEYPLSNFASPDLALSAVLTDSGFSCPANIANELFSLSVPTFGYELNDENAPMLFLPPVSFPYGATHTDELQFLFSLSQTPNPSTLSSAEQELAATMKAYWTNFAQNGNPNGGQPNWSPLSILADNVQSLTPPTPQVEFNLSEEHNCTFWEDILVQTALEEVAGELQADGIVP